MGAIIGRPRNYGGVYHCDGVMFKFYSGNDFSGLVALVFNRDIILPADITSRYGTEVSTSEWNAFIKKEGNDALIVTVRPISLLNLEKLVINLRVINNLEDSDDDEITKEKVYEDVPKEYHKFLHFIE